MKKSIALTLLITAALGAASVHAASVHADSRTRFMAANCAYCHGPDGHSRGTIPNLAGLDAKYFVDQMKAFRDGSRPATVMRKHAMGYTDAEYEAMGKWFDSHK